MFRNGFYYLGVMKKLLRSLVTLGVILSPIGAANAADDVVMVELYTSQGCSSCPPADANLGKLAQREDVLALSMHVDYWDYLGWRDTFADPMHTKRQIAYRDYWGARVIYTPQMVVHGQFDVPGYKPDMISEAIGSAQRLEKRVGIEIRQDGGMLKAIVTSQGPVTNSTIWMASYDRTATVAIQRGENAGEQITYHNVVDKLMRVGPRETDAAQEVALPLPEQNGGVAIWLQDDTTGRILTASYITD